MRARSLILDMQLAARNVIRTDAPDTIFGTQSTKLGLTKTDNLNPAIYDHVGQVVTYTLTATNISNITLHNVTVSDNPALDNFSCTPSIPVASLAPGVSVACTGTHTISQADLDAGSFADTASASSNEAPAPDAPDTILGTQGAKLSLTKTDDLNPAKYDHVGQVVTYTLTATNCGNVTLHNVGSERQSGIVWFWLHAFHPSHPGCWCLDRVQRFTHHHAG